MPSGYAPTLEVDVGAGLPAMKFPPKFNIR